jgi:TetR/AcrR family transcriptional regulator, transcriptional repressor for nem operon
MPRTKPAEERRADLLDAARKAFTEKGVSATTLEDITSGAGVSKGLFWQYFRSKDEVVFCLQQQYAERFAATVVSATGAVADWAGKLDACVAACFGQFRAEQDLHDVLFRHTGGSYEASAQPPAHTVLVDAIAALLAAGAADGAYQVDDAGAMASLLYAAMHAFDQNFSSRRQLPDADLRAAQLLFRRAAGIMEPPRQA